ncbi:MAG: Uma2 family endonuclease [Cyclobacteriaceae bacterium]|nr:MAG: Uma2 family endonuclease [Cyclobacteriaceae bacterium]
MESFILKFPSDTQFSDDEFFEFCAANDPLRIERNSKGQIIIMSPSGSKTGNIHFRIYSSLANWYDKNEHSGYIFDSSAGFKLPDQSVLAPDAAFVVKQRWESLTDEQQKKFAPLTPDFIIEVRSESDSLSQLKSKMDDWIRNGCRLAWLIDPIEKKAFIYRPNESVTSIDNFNSKLSGEVVLPGFELDLSKLL